MYLHGVEIKQVAGGVPFRESDTAIVGLVGIAEKGAVAQAKLITNLADAVTEYGRNLEGTTIMSALESIFADGNCPVLVVNVATGTKLTNMIDTNTTKVKLTSGGDLVTQVHKETLASTTGLVNFETELITGLDVLKTTESNLGLKSNFIIAPGYSQVMNIATKMREVAGAMKGKAIIDVYATNVAGAITKRTNDFNYADERVVLCYPNAIAYNVTEAKDVEIPLSQLWVNEMVSVHVNEGYWNSNSNRELKSIKRTKVPIISSIDDTGADTNLLNAKGIVTVFKGQGTGFRLWGNWTSAYPTVSNHKAQVAASIVKDVIEETIKRESMNFIDKNISYATLDYIVNNVQQFFYKLKGKGALVDGVISYAQQKNPITQISQGQFVFDYSYCEHPALDRLTYESFQDINMLKSIFKS